MSSRNRRARSFSRSSSRSRSRSRSSKHYHRNNKHDRNTTKQRKNNYVLGSFTDPSHDRSKSRSYSYSNSNSNSSLPSRSPSRSRSRSSNKKNYRENADLPSDHPLFSIVRDNKQQQQQLQPHNKTPSSSPPPTSTKNNHTNNPNNNNFDYQRSDNRARHHDKHANNKYRDWNHGHRDRDRDRDRDRHRGRYDRHRNRDRNRNRDTERDRHRDRDRDKDTGERGHNYHTGHKQQVLAAKKEALISPQITATQAQQIIAVTTIVQKQEEISSIVETQKRKLAQKTSLEKIKEKILLQKQQMLARKNKNKIKQTSSTSQHSQYSQDKKTNINNIFEAEVVIANKEALPNMTSMMNNNSHPNNNSIDLLQRQAIENLATFVKNHGIALEQTVRDRSKDDPKFSWLYDEQSDGYKYYQLLLHKQEDNVIKKRKRRRFSAHPQSQSQSSQIKIIKENNGNGKGKALDKMNAYIDKLENEEKEKKDLRFERSNQMSIYNGGSSHHIGHYLPENELNYFNNKYASQQPLTHNNRGHAMLKKLGWNEGKGLGKNEQGEIKPISSIIKSNQNQNRSKGKGKGKGHGNVNNKPWDPRPGDNQYDLYKKKMMLSYRYRPNPLGNPRKDYY